MKRVIKWLGLALLALVLIIALPVLYVETMCRGEPIAQADAQFITDPTDKRPEARTYLVYPEWHIVYAYEGYAEAIVGPGEPHNFPYISAITGFWSSLCGLTEKADELGEAGFDSKATIYTIGASFTLEMLLKAAYEETIGRLASLAGDSPQDAIEAEMAQDYATFLQQVPWYKYDFPAWNEKLWSAPVEGLRSWERRLAVGLEWGAKTQYAKLIAQAAAGLGADELTMKIAVTGVDPAWLAQQLDVEMLETQDGTQLARVARYRVFTTLAKTIADQGGTINELAGNDDILVSYIGPTPPETNATVISETARVGFPEMNRYLIATKVAGLTDLIRALSSQRGALEHIYDY